MESKINNPNAIVIIYNYQDRLGDSKLSKTEDDVFKIDQIILNSLSLKSVTTQKSKSNPAGNFEFRLAPLKNWVTAITPGSWCVILMSNESLNDKAKYGGGKVEEKSFKMMGRIESVRCISNVNQSSGAIESEYIVTGVDWGVIFASKFYVDPLNRAPQEQAMGMAARFGYSDYLLKSLGYDASTAGKAANPTAAKGALKKANTEGSKAAVNNSSNFIQGGSSSKDSTPSPLLIPSDAKQLPKDEKIKLPSALDNVGFLLKLWGQSDPVTSGLKGESGVVTKSQQVFKIPNQLAKYMGFVDLVSEVSPVVSQILQQKGGKLSAYDTYEDKDFSCGIVDFSGLLGEHTVWQLISNNCNDLINELIPEVRFDSNKPTLTLYNRVKPFAVNSLDIIKRDTNTVGDSGIVVNKPGSEYIQTPQKAKVDPFISSFKNIRTKNIKIRDVIMCSYGTNWRDRINFIEVTIGRTLFQETFSSAIKLDAQFIDEGSVGRDGLLSMITSTTYLPVSIETGVANPVGVSAYKHAMKEWYFNTHKMFNGTLSLIGQDQYIQVGDNIMVNAKILNKNYNLNSSQKKEAGLTYLLAHVESITNQTVVDNNGSRIFTTSINFVRGIIVDGKKNVIVSNGQVGAVDQDASLVEPSTERNRETISTSTAMDPDRQRYPIRKGDPEYSEDTLTEINASKRGNKDLYN